MVGTQPGKSMWKKYREKKEAKKHHSGNFNTGYVAAKEHYLNRSGLRGRKRWIFFAIFLLVCIVTLAHLTITCIILGVLEFRADGFPFLVFNSNGGLVWPAGARISDVRVADAIRTYSGSQLSVSGQEVTLEAGSQRNVPSSAGVLNPSQITINESSVNFLPFTSIFVSSNGQSLLAANSSLIMVDRLSNLESLKTTRIVANTIRGSNQNTEATGPTINLVGARGLFLGGGQVDISGRSISFSQEMAEVPIQFQGRTGIALQGLPQITSAGRNDGSQYHLCACSSGKLFRVPANPRRCAAANGPCS